MGVEPLADETPDAFLERACRGPLATACRYVVPEARATVLAAKVWRTLKKRAHDAYAACRPCQSDITYGAAISIYDKNEVVWQTRARELGPRAEPKYWPRAGKAAVPFSATMRLDVGFEPPTLDHAYVARGGQQRRGGDRESHKTQP